MSAALKFDMASFNSQVSQTRQMLHRNGRSYVRTTARRLIRRLAWNAPHAPLRYGHAGRLRAGFWAAAEALSIRNIYTRAPNKGEGGAMDNTNSSNPSFTIVNAVPYIGNLKDLAWIETAKQAVMTQMARDLTKYVQSSWSRNALIDDLSAE